MYEIIRKRLNAFLTFHLVLFINGMMAQGYTANIKKIGMNDGLSSYNVNVTFQDSDGYMWIGTDYGLNRYDGSTFKTFTKEENGLCHNYVKGIFEDQNKMLWIASCDIGGDWFYCIFDKYKQQFFHWNPIWA